MAKKEKTTEGENNKTVDGEVTETVNDGLECKLKKKKHKKRKNGDKIALSDNNDRHSSLAEGERKMKKRHNKNDEGETGEVTSSLPSKKKKKKHRDNNNRFIDDVDFMSRAKKMVKPLTVDENANCTGIEVSILDNCPDEFSGKVKRKKKKKKHENCDAKDQPENGHEANEKHKKKRKKKAVEESRKESGAVRNGNVSDEASYKLPGEDFSEKKRRKGMKRKSKEKVGTCDELSSDSRKKHKRKKDDAEVSPEEMVDEESVMKERRKKKMIKSEFQEEGDGRISMQRNGIDRGKENESHKKPDLAGVHQGSEDHSKQGFGQWSSADLGNADRKQKFLRLLGGMKESEADKKQTVQMKLINIAMGSTSQESYMNSLEEQFEKAREISIFGPKGGGLGYESVPGGGSKFHINPVKSRSVKFDD
ncbi:hypothetical protein LSH36_107g01008 [Paralvinella palmiformis]|uniref:Small acidic protein n=1 Tax=Paralvinella palmiformis TaxID=53620 RepID=A0AAD9NAY8_9ANNE|nr:hypothetical protein LSH36_107g01008 [Paralvinella palmiformis]